MTFKLLSLMLGGFVLLKKEKLSICMFCKTEVESPEDIFFLLQSSVCVFWKEILSWTARYNKDVNDISLPDVLFGKFNSSKDFMIINHILLLAKFFYL